MLPHVSPCHLEPTFPARVAHSAVLEKTPPRACRSLGPMSTKTTPAKLQLKPKTSVWASDFARLDLVRPLPDGVRHATGPAEATTAVVFADDAASLKQILEANKHDVAAPATLWIAYPKANRTDINRDTVWPIAG